MGYLLSETASEQSGTTSVNLNLGRMFLMISLAGLRREKQPQILGLPVLWHGHSAADLPSEPFSLSVDLRRLVLTFLESQLSGPKNSPRQLLKVLASLRSFVVFVFHSFGMLLLSIDERRHE